MDSKFLEALAKLPLWIVLILWLPAAVLIGGHKLGCAYFSGLTADQLSWITIAGVVSFCIMLARVIWLFGSFLSRQLGQKTGVAKPFHKLTQQQQKLLLDTFASGRRDFTLPQGGSNARWIEDLIRFRYIEQTLMPVYMSGSPDFLDVTEAGWKILEKQSRRDRS